MVSETQPYKSMHPCPHPPLQALQQALVVTHVKYDSVYTCAFLDIKLFLYALIPIKGKKHTQAVSS